MRLWIGFRHADQQQYALPSETLLKAFIKDTSQPSEDWTVYQIETGKIDVHKICAIISGKQGFTESVLQEYKGRVTEGGQFRKEI